MKIKIIFILFFVSQLLNAQTGFGDARLIGDDFQTTKVFSADLDGDGDMDVLTSGWNANTIAWYENLDGQGNFGAVHYIDQNLIFTHSLSTADFDGDSDIDILATSKANNRVVWYKNIDGQGNFSTAIIVDFNAPNVDQALAADIDGDNDMDIVAAISNESKVVWYENINGLGNFSAEMLITNIATGVYSIAIADVDGDGFLDVLANSSSIAKPSWYKNLDGLGTFGTENIIDLIGTIKLVAVDIDGDNDVDIFKTEAVNSVVTLHWLENTDGQGAYEQRQLISDDFQISDIYPTDADNDGDQDLLVTFVGDGKIAWFENLDGLGTFGDRKIVENLASISIVAADIDGDGYKDIVTRINQSQVVWYKNETYLAIKDHNLQNVILTPNPTSGIVYIEGLLQPLTSVTVYDVFGKLLLKKLQATNIFNLSQLPTGLYFIKLETNNGFTVKKIIRE